MTGLLGLKAENESLRYYIENAVNGLPRTTVERFQQQR